MNRENNKNQFFKIKKKEQIVHSDLLKQFLSTLSDVFDICILTDENEIVINSSSAHNIKILQQKPLIEFVDISYKNEYNKAITSIRKYKKPVKFNLRFAKYSKIFKVKCLWLQDENAKKYLVFNFLDNTKLNELSASLLSSENRFRTIVNYTASWENWISPSGDLLFINPAVKKITGYSFEESIWLFQHPTKYIYGEDSKRVVDKVVQSLRDETSGTDIFRLIKKDKSIIWMSSQWNPVYGKDGDYQGLRLSLHDITEIKHTQKLLEKNLVQFKKVNNELKAANKKIEEIAEAEKIFIANMSHLVRTPLNAILGMTELLYGSSLLKEQTEMVEIIEYSAEKLLTVINDIVDIKKIESDKITLENKGFNLYDKFMTVFNVFKLETKNKNLDYSFYYPDKYKNLIVKSDANRLAQIIFNLLNNAIKYTYKGSVKLEIKIKEISLNKVGVNCSISDTGIGIPEENQPYIFDGFSKPETQIAKKFKGSGLGLFITKKLVEIMGGTMNVSSVADRGSVFYLYFEFEKTEKIEIASRKNFKQKIEQKQKELQNIHILLVEDQEFNQLLIKKIAANWMCNLDIATNGQSAIEMLNKKNYDIILMDIQLPVMSGLQATEIIRNKMPEPIKSIPIIALTANAMEGDYEKYKETGMNGYLAKPFKSQDLYKIIISNLKKNKNTAFSKKAATKKEYTKNTLYSLKKILEIAKGDKSYIVEMIQVFIDQCIEIKKDMIVAIDEGNTYKLGELAHKLKSSVNIMCLAKIEKPVLKVVELARNNKNTQQIISLAELIIKELNIIIPLLKVEFEKRL